MPLLPQTLAATLAAFLAPADLAGFPRSADESAEKLARAYAAYVTAAAPPLLPAGLRAQQAVLAQQLQALYESRAAGAAGFLGAFTSFWSAPPPSMVAGATALVGAGFAPAAGAGLDAAIAAAQAGGTRKAFVDHLAAALHAGTLAVTVAIGPSPPVPLS